MRIQYRCHFGRLTGYGRAAHDYLLALKRAGAELSIVPLGKFDPAVVTHLEPQYRELLELVGRSQEPEIVVIHTWPGNLTLEPLGVPAVAVTTWETYLMPNRIGDGDMAALLRRFARVVVPSPWCREVIPFGERAVVPHCFDPTFWRAVTESGEDPAPDGPYTFYTIGVWSERKNPMAILKAYLAEFTADDDVRLVMIAPDADTDAVRRLLSQSGLPPSRLPNLVIPAPRPLSGVELRDMHRGGHCFVTASRGEGFGLGAFEAAVLGKPVIAPIHTGLKSFLDGYAYDVVWNRTPAFPTERAGAIRAAGLEVPFGVRSVAHGVDCKQWWAEPHVDSLMAQMRECCENRYVDDHSARAEFEANYSYAVVGRAFLQLLQGAIQ